MPLGSAGDVFATEDPKITEAAKQELKVYEKKDNVLHGHRKKRKCSRISKDDDVEMTQDAEDSDPYDFTDYENSR